MIKNGANYYKNHQIYKRRQQDNKEMCLYKTKQLGKWQE